MRHLCSPRKYHNWAFWSTIYITSRLPIVVIIIGERQHPFRFSPCLSLSTSSGQHQRSTPTIRRPGRSLYSTQSTSMGGSSFSLTWASSSRSGHGEYFPTSKPPLPHIILTMIRYAFPPLVWLPCAHNPRVWSRLTFP